MTGLLVLDPAVFLAGAGADGLGATFVGFAADCSTAGDEFLGGAGAGVGATVLFKTAAGGGRLKSIPDEEGEVAGAGTAGLAGWAIHEGVKALASALGMNAPAFGLRLKAESVAAGGVLLPSLSCADMWLFKVKE